jgi:hypothetical protein
VLDQNGAGVEQVEAATLGVLLGSGSRLRDDDGNIAPGGRGVDEPRREQRRLDAQPAVRRRGAGAGHLGDATGDAQPGPAGERAVVQRDVAGDAGRGEIPFGRLVRRAGELLVPGQALGVGFGDGVGQDSEPPVRRIAIPGSVTGSGGSPRASPSTFSNDSSR